MRGPERHQESPDHEYFQLSRPMIALSATLRRRRTFLEDEDWITVPWAARPHTKTSQHFVQDLAARLPGYMEDYASITMQAAAGHNICFRVRLAESSSLRDNAKPDPLAVELGNSARNDCV